MDQTEGIDPFQKSVTIASLCHYIYRTKQMEPETIAIYPKTVIMAMQKLLKRQ